MFGRGQRLLYIVGQKKKDFLLLTKTRSHFVKVCPFSEAFNMKRFSTSANEKGHN
jgi:hypothetical protein